MSKSQIWADDYLESRLLLLFPEGDGGILGMFSGHFDESADARKERVFTIAGYVGHTGEALDLHWRWQKALRSERLPYFKASQCEFGFGPFAKYRDDPKNVEAPLTAKEKERLTGVKKKFVDLANSSQMVGIATTIVTEDFDRLLKKKPKYASVLGKHPYFTAYQAVLMDAGLLIGYLNRKWRSRHILAPIFDEIEEVSGRAKQMYDEFKERNPQTAKWLIPVSYESEHRFKVIQAADNLAYEVNKWRYNIRYDSQRDERKAMVRLKEKVYRISEFDGEMLEYLVKNGLSEKTLYAATTLQDYDIHSLAPK